MAVSTNTAPVMSDADQELYSTSMLTLMNEDGGGELWEFAEQSTGKGGKAIFYRLKSDDTVKDNGALSGNTAMNLYTGDGDAGDVQKFEATLKYASGGNNISQAELANTTLDLKSSYLQSQVNKIARHRDLDVLSDVHAKVTAGTIATTTYAKGKTFKDDEVVETLLARVAYAVSLGMSNPDYPDKKVAIVMNRSDYADLYANKYFLSSDYAKMVNGGTMGSAMGVKFVPYGSVTLAPKGEVAILPAKSFGMAEDPATKVAGIQWAHGILKWQCACGVHAGGVAIDADAISYLKESTT